MVSVTLLMCSLLATSASAQAESEATGLMHTNAKVEMAVSSSGEINVRTDDEMELLSNKHLVLQKTYIEQMEASTLFMNVPGGRCLSSNVDKKSRLTFEACDNSSTAQMWTKRADGSYHSLEKYQQSDAEELCPRMGAHVKCGRNSTVLGSCPGFKATTVVSDEFLGQKHGAADPKTLVLQDQTNNNCLAVYMKGKIETRFEDLVVATPGKEVVCGVRGFGSEWKMLSVSQTALAAAADKAADSKIRADEDAKMPLFQVMPVEPGQNRCAFGTAITDATQCQAAMNYLGLSPFELVGPTDESPPGCYANKIVTKVFYNSDPTGQDDAGAPSICRVSADN